MTTPLIKYPGGKAWLARLLGSRVRAHLEQVGADAVFSETFAGGLAFGLEVGWLRGVYGDVLDSTVNLHQSVALPEFLQALDRLRQTTGEEAYYEIRKSIWPGAREQLHPGEWAARTVWLSKNCFNGLVRHAPKTGRFNVSWGKRSNVELPSCEHVEEVARVLGGALVLRADFGQTLACAVRRAGDPRKLVVYLDPPYLGHLENEEGVAATHNTSFVGYAGEFRRQDHLRLAAWAKTLDEAGALVILSNTLSNEVREIYGGLAHFKASVRHNIGAKAERRGSRSELVAISSRYAESVAGGIADLERL